MLWVLLLLSVGGLLLGPLVVALGRGNLTLTAVIDGLTLGIVPMLVVTRLLPHTMESLHLWAGLLAVTGFVAVSFAHRGGHRLEARIGRAVVVPTLFLHALVDGAGLAIASRTGGGGWLLGAALVLHRLPEGLFVATALAPPSLEGRVRPTFIPVALLALGTLLGALFGQSFLDRVPDRLVDGVVAFGLGAMLRLVFHTHAEPHSRRGRAASAIAFLGGIVIVLALPDAIVVFTRAPFGELSMVQSAMPLFIKTAPAFLIGVLATAALHAFGPRRLTIWLRGGGQASQAARGVAFGVELPICSCGVVPVANKLFVLGIPAAAVVAFAVASPELGLDTALLSLRLLGWKLTVARLVASATLAFVVALVVSRFASAPHASSFGSFGAPAPQPATRSSAIADFVDNLDHLGAWHVVGILVASVLEASVNPAFAAKLPSPFDMIASVAIAVPLYVCAQGGTPIAAMMIHKGFSIAAALSMLLVGPATSFPILSVLRREIGTRAAIAFAATSIAAAMIVAFVIGRIVPVESVPSLHPWVARDHHLHEWIAAAVLVAMLVSSVLRMGPRGWFAAMAIDSHEEHVHEHGCGHDHDAHDHVLN